MTTQLFLIKIVPKATPNADGEWRQARAEVRDGMRWLDLAMVLDDHVPPTHFLVAFERVPHAAE